ncbi:MAG: YebC/PmpR family DNA-binding transcriptional regulator, partial [Bacteroidota bacterium]
MSGHSKWSTIKRKKGALDAKRSKIFSRISKELTVAAKTGGSDPENNPRLRLAVQNARGQNMSKDVIERAINKAEKDTASFEEMTFEGYGPGGVAIFVECLSD